MLEKEILSMDEVMGMVGGKVDGEEVRIILATGQATEDVPADMDPYHMLQEILSRRAFVQIPQWMSNSRHKQLAVRLVSSPLWITTPEEGRKNLSLRIVKGHFRNTDRTITQVTTQLQQMRERRKLQ